MAVPADGVDAGAVDDRGGTRPAALLGGELRGVGESPALFARLGVAADDDLVVAVLDQHHQPAVGHCRGREAARGVLAPDDGWAAGRPALDQALARGDAV